MAPPETATPTPASPKPRARYVGYVPRPESFGDPVKPKTTMERYLKLLWEREIEFGPVGVEDDFFTVGGDSFHAVAIFSAIEKDYGIKIYPSAIVEAPTIRELAAHIQAKLDAGDKTEPTLITFRAAGDRPPLYVIHGAGGEVMFAQPLADALGEDQPVYGFRNTFDKPDRRTTVGDFAERYLAYLPGEGPVGLIGYSGGSLIAFEMACRLRAAGREVRPLVIIDLEAPGFLKAKKVSPLQRAVRAARRSLGALRRPGKSNGAMPDGAVRDAYGGIGAGDVRKTMAWAVDTYKPGFYDGPVHVVTTEGKLSRKDRADLGWSDYARGPVETAHVEGTHWSIMMAPRVEEIAEFVRRARDGMG